MKTCPMCSRAYNDETMNFCLDDGSTLSDSYDPDKARSMPPTRLSDPPPTQLFNPRGIPADDPDKARSLPPTRLSNPPPTELLNPRRTPSDSEVTLIPTIQSLQPPPSYSANPQAPPIKKESGQRWIGITFGILILGAVVVLSLVWFAQSRESGSRRETNTNANVAPSPTPTATAVDVWNKRNDGASLTGENLTYYPGTTPEHCQSDCEKNQECKGFTFIRKGAYNPGDPPMCYLASAVTGETTHSCCISAVKR